MRRFTLLFLAPLFATLPVLANTISSAEIDGYGTTVISGDATAIYLLNTTLDPGFLSPSATAFSITAGPERPGFIQISAHGGATGGVSQVTIGSYSFTCDDLGCRTAGGFSLNTPAPFLLGDPFHVTVSASASKFGTGSAMMNFSFFMTEGANLDYARVIIDDPPDVPEPATMLLSACGLALLVAGKRIRQRT